MTILAVIGGQYGSEGKGVIVHHLANRFPVHVRVGGPNAGHSFYFADRLWKMQSLPCGWTNYNATLVIGAGAVVSLEQLAKELDLVEEMDPKIRKRVFIDAKAAIILKEHREFEESLKEGIGSTGEGVGGCRAARLFRGERLPYLTAGDCALAIKDLGIQLVDTVLLLYFRRKRQDILLEGTQGCGLSLIHGEWPYVTSHDVSTAQLLADCGLPVRDVQTLMVVRTYPIRVGGNSGPLKGEISWGELSRRIGVPVREYTTVTNKQRRVAEWDDELVRSSIIRNQPDYLALTFVDYLDPEDQGKQTFESLSPESQRFVRWLEDTYRVPVKFIGTGWRGNNGWTVIER